MDISSIALTNFTTSSDVPIIDVDCVEIYSTVAIGAVGASEAANVEGTVVETVGMTFTEVVAISLFFDWIKV